tara:strand:+ start:375 stop:488 length:114 start_codon:yes stop_codon:yes gene_type:complete
LIQGTKINPIALAQQRGKALRDNYEFITKVVIFLDQE